MDYIYDIEFYPNFFCVNIRTPDNAYRKSFEISNRKDDRVELIEVLEQSDIRMVGFNNNHYDYPVLHYLLENPQTKLLNWFRWVQKNIFKDETFIIFESQRKVKQIDLFKINHYDNMARRSSLKWLEFTMRWHKVQDLPITPNTNVPEGLFDEMVKYCWNDVDFTYQLYLMSLNAIKLRERMGKKYKTSLMDCSDVKIGEYINRVNYEELSGIKYKDFKNKRTFHKQFDLIDIIPEFIEFHTPEMKKFIEELKNVRFRDGDPFERTIHLGGVEIKFAKGGLHSVDSPRIQKRKEGWTLMEKDVGSMYPRFIVVNGVYP